MNEAFLIGHELAEQAVNRLAGGDRNRVWGSMVYACQGREDSGIDPCGHEERYYLGVGVEGPTSLRAVQDKTAEKVRAALPERSERPVEEFWRPLRDRLAEIGGTIPAPYTAGRCPNCNIGVMQHVRFDEDEDLGDRDPFPYPPPGARYFRVPDAPRARHMATFENYGGAELVVA